MSSSYLPELISFLLLGLAFYALWRQRLRFQSLLPLVFAALFIALSRLAMVMLEHPRLQQMQWFGLSRHSLQIILDLVADFSDVLGVLLLVLGFLQTIKFLYVEEKKIETLSELLPICAGCKKIRTETGGWKPVEHYLLQSGSPPLTHTFCPDCESKIREQIKAAHK